MRLFYALTFHHADKEKFAHIGDAFKVHTTKGSYMSTDNFHMTLLFLGDVKEEQVPFYLLTLSSLITHTIEISVNRFGVFEKKNKHILWLGIKDNHLVKALHQQLVDILEIDQHVHTGAHFTPHITLARNIRVEGQFESFQEIMVNVKGVALMESVRVNGKLLYRPIKEYLLR